MVEANQRPFGDQLPDLPPLDLEQDNIPLNSPNQPQDLPMQEKEINSIGQRNQIKFLTSPPEPEELDQLEQPNPPPNQPNQPNQPNSAP